MKNSIILLIFCAFFSPNTQGKSLENAANYSLENDIQQSIGDAQIWFDPATNLLHLLFNTHGVRDKINVQVGNSDGIVANEVFSTSNSPIIHEVTIDLSGVPAALYHVKVTSRSISAYSKFVIK